MNSTTITWRGSWKLSQVTNYAADDVYTLLIYVSDVHGNIPREYFNITPFTAIEHSIAFRHMEQGLAPFLHVWLFVTSSNDDTDHALSQSLCACGSISLRTIIRKNEHMVSLYDTEHNKQASLTIATQTWSPRLLNSTYVVDRPLLLSFDMNWITLFSERYYQPSMVEYIPRKQAYTKLSTPLGDLPLLCFPMMMTMVSDEFWTQPNNHVIWEYFLDISLLRLGLGRQSDIFKSTSSSNNKEEKKHDEDDDEDDASQFQYHLTLLRVLGEMLCLISHGHLYVDDHIRTSPTQVRIIDSWTNLGVYPNPGLIGRDCEDASGFVYQLIHILRNITLQTHTLLYQIQYLLNQYTAFIALGTQYVGPGDDDYFPHAFVILHESTYVDQLIATTSSSSSHSSSFTLPSLLLDTVNYIESVWYEPEWETSEYRHRMKQSQEEEQLIDNNPKWRRFLKPYVLAHRLHDNEQYGDVSHLLTSHHRDQALHLILKQPSLTKQFKIGYSVPNLLLKQATANNIEVALALTQEQCISLHTCLAEFPWTTMLPPLSPPTIMSDNLRQMDNYYHRLSLLHTNYTAWLSAKKRSRKRTLRQMAFTIRTIDYIARKDEIRTLFTSLYPTCKLYAYTCHLTSNIQFTELNVQIL